jgi:hypothetical protein
MNMNMVTQRIDYRTRCDARLTYARVVRTYLFFARLSRVAGSFGSPRRPRPTEQLPGTEARRARVCVYG